MDAETIEKLKQMLGVPIDKVEESGDEILVHVPKDQVAKAIGSGGSVVRSAELILKKKLTIEESTGQ
jgi:transcription antitermination factor NusA-like protein